MELCSINTWSTYIWTGGFSTFIGDCVANIKHSSTPKIMRFHWDIYSGWSHGPRNAIVLYSQRERLYLISMESVGWLISSNCGKLRRFQFRALYQKLLWRSTGFSSRTLTGLSSKWIRRRRLSRRTSCPNSDRCSLKALVPQATVNSLSLNQSPSLFNRLRTI